MSWWSTTETRTKISIIFIIRELITFWDFLISSWWRSLLVELLGSNLLDLNIFLSHLAIIFMESSSLSIDSSSEDWGSSFVVLNAIPFFGWSFSSSSFKWISCVRSFPRRSSKLKVLRSWASSIAVTLGPHLLLGRHLKIFLTISSFVYVLPKDLRLLYVSEAGEHFLDGLVGLHFE